MTSPTQASGAKGQTSRRIAHLSIDLDKLNQAQIILEQAGYVVTTAPIDLWPHRNIINAYNPVTGEGYLIGPDELGLICHYGVVYLNPHGFDEPRYKAKDNSSRIKHYAEAAIAGACTEVAIAAPGTSNTALNKAAYLIGRFMSGWQLDPDSSQAQLLGVALDRGIKEHEARAVINAGIKAGAKNPRDPNELLDELVGKPKENDIAAKHLAKLSRRLGGRP